MTSSVFGLHHATDGTGTSTEEGLEERSGLLFASSIAMTLFPTSGLRIVLRSLWFFFAKLVGLGSFKCGVCILSMDDVAALLRLFCVSGEEAAPRLSSGSSVSLMALVSMVLAADFFFEMLTSEYKEGWWILFRGRNNFLLGHSFTTHKLMCHLCFRCPQRFFPGCDDNILCFNAREALLQLNRWLRDLAMLCLVNVSSLSRRLSPQCIQIKNRACLSASFGSMQK